MDRELKNKKTEKLLVILLVTSVILLIVAASVIGTLLYKNKTRLDRWEKQREEYQEKDVSYKIPAGYELNDRADTSFC
ncbi:MAG: hypothetical protein HFH53_07900 [Hespellia sp.]|nr:hypothetical protein [Hespellia sp.]